MPLSRFLRWFRPVKAQTHRNFRVHPTLTNLERREVPAGYLGIGAGPGSLAAVAIRVDIQDQLGGAPPNNLGQPPVPRSDGRTDFTSQIFFPFGTGFRGGVHTAAGNFDGLYATPDSLVTAAGSGGGPHVIVWNMQQLPTGAIVTNGIRDQFFAFDPRFRGGVNVTTGDLDGDGRAELIVGAGPGGGPHVKVYRDVGGRFQLANEFFAFDPGFRGGVTISSGQGYKTVQQIRLVIGKQYEDDNQLQVTPYDDPSQSPGTLTGVPLVGLDYPLLPGSTEPFINPFGATGTPYVVPNGVEGHLDDQDNPFPYFTIGAGVEQYLSGNLLSSLGNIIYRPVIQVAPPNEDGIGEYVTAKWTADAATFPGAPFVPEQLYGPFVRIGKTADDIDIITRLTIPPDAVTFKNQLVVGAGPGGGPHVKIFDFTGTFNGKLTNNGVGKEFFAFDPAFRGGVNVGIGNVIEHQHESRIPGRIDYTVDPPQFIIDTTENSGTQVFTNIPFDTELYRRDQPEVIVSMASGGSEVRVFADLRVKTADPTNPFTDPAPARRTSLVQLNLQSYGIDLVPVVDPTNPLGGYGGFATVQSLGRAIDNPSFTGGVNFTQGAFNFLGSADTRFYGQGTVGGGGAFAVNPALAQSIFGAGVTPAGQANRASRVRIFNQLAPISPLLSEYGPYDDFQAFVADPNAKGAWVSYGFGALPEPGLDVNYAPRDAPGGIPNGTALDLYMPDDTTDPILV